MTIRSVRVATILIAAAFALAACVGPGVKPRGPSIKAPSMTANAFILSDGMHLPKRDWAPKKKRKAKLKAIIIGVHGMNDYSNAFAMPGAFFAQHDILTIAYDQRGFGDAPDPGTWAGSQSMVDDLSEVAGVVHVRYPKTPIYLMGVSMGAAVVLAAAGAHELPPVDGVILAAPAVWGWQSMNIAYKLTLWTGAHVMPDKTLTGERLDILPSDNIDMLRAMSQDPKVIKKTKLGVIYGLVGLMDRGYKGAYELDAPTLLLYGKNDHIVPKEPVMEVAKRIHGPLRMLYYSNGYHMLERDLEAKTVWRDIIAWISNPKAKMPSVTGGSAPAAEELKFKTEAAQDMRTSKAR